MTLQTLDQQYVMKTYREKPVCFVRGEGSTLFDDTGRPYHDLLSGLAVTGLGHAHPAVTARIAEQAGRLLHVSNLFLNEWQPQLAQELAVRSSMERTFFTNSGTEAMECALKLARKFGHGKGIEVPVIVSLKGAFHGRSFGALSATPTPAYQQPFTPLVPGFVAVPANDIGALEAALTDEVCALVLEPIQGESGVHPLSPDFLESAAALCAERDILLIADEIQCGMYRTGTFLATQGQGIAPDVVLLAKALANGLPIGGCLARGKAAEVLAPGDHGSTFGGNPLVTAVALTVLNESAQLTDHVLFLGGWFRTALSEVAGVTAVRGSGLMLGVALEQPVGKAACGKLLERGFVVNAVGESTLRLLPPLIIQQATCEAFLATLASVLAELPVPEVTA